jgi:tRNA A-37 threonylcarbamoyl transferase component Bud32/CheY-like chemotaxis protein
MPELDAQSLADHAVMIGLVARPQAREALANADDGSYEAVVRSFLRSELLTSWQIERLNKGDPSGFFYGGCKVLFHLAEGTFARVYRGERVDSRSPVAIKVLRQRFGMDPGAVERFRKEAEAGMKLAHPNIVRILDFGEQDRKHYMIMEYVEGSNLRDLLKIRQRITSDAALPLMLGLARGLQYSIERGVTHRDIKGTNILISHSGEAKLVDFGLATIEGDSRPGGMQSQRTVDYSALERTCGSEKGDPRSDIYFLGCVFYQMLTGQLPMKEVESKDMLAKMLKRSFGAIIPLSEHRLAPDPELAEIVEKMMRMELKARYQTLDEVLKDLEAYERRARGGITGIEVSTSDEPEFLADFDSLFTGGHAASLEGGGGDPSSAQQQETNRERKKHVLCVENQPDIQDAFRKTLTKMGYRVFLVSDAERAAERYRESPPDAVIFDLDGLGPEAIDSFIDMHDKAHEDGRDLAALVLLGPRQGHLRENLPSDDRLIILGKPIKMKQVQSAVQLILPIGK